MEIRSKKPIVDAYKRVRNAGIDHEQTVLAVAQSLEMDPHYVADAVSDVVTEFDEAAHA